MEQNLLVGYARVDITPLESVPLRGYGNTSNRMSVRVLDSLYATCLALTCGEETLLLYSLDLCTPGDIWPERICHAIGAASGVAKERIFASATHTHSGPDPANDLEASIPRYFDLLERKAVEAAVCALADRKEAAVFTAAAQTDSLNFVRRYILQDGTPAGDNYGHFKESPIRCHESHADSNMQFVKFIREGSRDILMVNFQTHPHRTGGSKCYDISADIVGVMRAETEKRLNCDFIYFTGASANINPTSRIPEENVYVNYLEHGRAMADVAVSMQGSYVPVAARPIKVQWNILDCPLDHTQDHRVEQAQYIVDNFNASGDRITWTKEAKKRNFNSVYHAGAVIAKSRRPISLEVPLAAISVGDLGIVLAPYEMFDTNGQYIKEHSPFPMTFILSCANRSSMGYVPSELGFRNSGYSSDVCWFPPGTGERFAEEFVATLHALKEEKL